LTGETEVLGEKLPQGHFAHHKSHMTSNLGRRYGKPATNRLSYGTVPSLGGCGNSHEECFLWVKLGWGQVCGTKRLGTISLINLFGGMNFNILTFVCPATSRFMVFCSFQIKSCANRFAYLFGRMVWNYGAVPINPIYQ
jgi:hypothetical protein